MRGRTLEIQTSPHVHKGSSTNSIMWNVVVALAPTTLFAVYAFGWAAVATLTMATLSCVATEHLLCKASDKPSTIGDGSAVITGLLFGLTLPPTLPLWMTFVGGFLCIGLGKSLFGGLGNNPFNPALVGRAVLQAAFPVPMTTWVAAFGEGRFSGLGSSILTAPLSRPVVDVVSGATPLSAWKFDSVMTGDMDLLLGNVPGSVGETCAVLILLGGVYLVARKMMNWRIPVVIFAAAAAFSGIFYLMDPVAYPSPQFMLLSGGMMLGAVFMASDMVGSPMTTRGILVYGTLIGVLTVGIRLWGGMPEGMMYAILLGNAATPHIDKYFQPRIYGTGKGAS